MQLHMSIFHYSLRWYDRLTMDIQKLLRLCAAFRPFSGTSGEYQSSGHGSFLLAVSSHRSDTQISTRFHLLRGFYGVWVIKIACAALAEVCISLFRISQAKLHQLALIKRLAKVKVFPGLDLI